MPIPELPELPRNLWELLAWIQVYRNSIYVRLSPDDAPDGPAVVALAELPSELAVQHVKNFADRWLANGAIPVRVKTESARHEEFSRLVWLALGVEIGGEDHEALAVALSGVRTS